MRSVSIKNEAGNATDSPTSTMICLHVSTTVRVLLFQKYIREGILQITATITSTDSNAGSSIRNAIAVQVFILIKSTFYKAFTL